METKTLVENIIFYVLVALSGYLAWNYEHCRKDVPSFKRKIWFGVLGFVVVGFVALGLDRVILQQGFNSISFGLGQWINQLSSGFQQGIKSVSSGVLQAVGPCLGVILAIIAPLIFEKLKRVQIQFLIAGFGLFIFGGIALFSPSLFSSYWLPILMTIAYLIGVSLAWQRSHSEPPPNYHFSQGGQYAFSMSIDYETPWEQSKLRGKVFSIAYLLVIGLIVIGRSGGWWSGFWLVALGVLLLISEIGVLFSL